MIIEASCVTSVNKNLCRDLKEYDVYLETTTHSNKKAIGFLINDLIDSILSLVKDRLLEQEKMDQTKMEEVKETVVGFDEDVPF